MAITKGHRFTIAFDEAFPLGLVMIGEVAPDNEYQSREDEASGRPTRQRVDEVTGKRQWKATGFKAAASGGGAKPSRNSGSANSGEPTAKAA
jgi:hypothetical protein